MNSPRLSLCYSRNVLKRSLVLGVQSTGVGNMYMYNCINNTGRCTDVLYTHTESFGG